MGKIEEIQKTTRAKIKLMFVQKSFSYVRMNEIKKRTDTNTGSFYYAWGNKEGLLQDIVIDDITESLDSLSLVIRTPNLIDALEEAWGFTFRAKGATDLDWEEFFQCYFDAAFPVNESRLCDNFSLVKAYFINDSIKHLLLPIHNDKDSRDDMDLQKALRVYPGIKEYRIIIWEKIIAFVLKNHDASADTAQAGELIHDFAEQIIRRFDALSMELISLGAEEKKLTFIEDEKKKFLKYWSREIALILKEITGGEGRPIAARSVQEPEQPASFNIEDLVAVVQNGDSLVKVTNQSEEIVIAAVASSGQALRYAHNPSPLACLVAVCRDGLALKSVPKKLKTTLIKTAAATQNGKANEFF
jgi:AcrR family transcriptional regulator